MSGFWDIFKKTAYFRASWHIQDLFIDSYNKIRYTAEKAEQMRSMRRNSKEINKALNDNPFARKRKKS
ncbi:MAG: hypothetical protein CMD14_00585 [Flavobacteriales bacterium]|mgnify:CR=1 FL=1|nr:hypothetical protein [Flavobacteriales bacterium]|tara:strand:+ start:1453 stop:1656 length:204 start_codon:yes stop_codon:yes gene_type:complete